MALKVAKSLENGLSTGKKWEALVGGQPSHSVENEESQSGAYLISQKFLNRSRRSPCGDDLINACRGRSSSSGTRVVEELIRSHPTFFSSPPSTPDAISWKQTLNYTALTGLEQILESGIPSNFDPPSSHGASLSGSSITIPFSVSRQ